MAEMVMEARDLERHNLAQVRAEFDTPRGPELQGLSTIVADNLAAIEIVFPTGRRLLIDFNEGLMEVSDTDDGYTIDAGAESIVHALGMGKFED